MTASSPTHRFASPVRILYVIDEMEAITAGGTERQILQMIALMRRSGAEMQLCTLRGTSWLTEQQAGCPVAFFQIQSVFGLQGLRQLMRMRRWMRSQRFQIVQTFFVESSLVGPVVARLAGVPVVIGSRRNLNWWMDRKLAWAQRFSNLFATRLLANCEAVRRVVLQTEGASEDKVDVVYNGVDTAWFVRDLGRRERTRAVLGVLPQQVVIGNTATLRPMKGLESFLAAAAIVYKEHPDIRILLVGDGPLRPELEALIDRLGLREICILAGSQQDMRPYLDAMDIGVLSSESEGFSNSILEYLAAGVACIATDVGGNAEALGGAGRLVGVGDVAGLARAIAEFVENADLRRQCAAAALQRAQRFSLTTAQAALTRYYQGLLGSSSAASGD
jgi:L-malate glycosyltransferase